MLFVVTGDKPTPVKPQRDVRHVPGWLLERTAAVAGIDVSKARSPTKLPKIPAWGENRPTIVPWTPDAEALLARIKEAVDDHERRVVPEGRPFVRRIVENAIKLALVVAVGHSPDEPVITEATFEWAASVAWTCTAAMLAEVTERLADNQREANYKKIVALIKKAGPRGITEGRLFDRCKAIDGWQRKEILEELTRAGQARFADNDNTKGRPAKRLVWVG